MKKKFFFETKNQAEFEENLKKFQKSAKEREDSVFFGVMKGKLSEGLDMPNEAVRLVIVVGIPLS